MNKSYTSQLHSHDEDEDLEPVRGRILDDDDAEFIGLVAPVAEPTKMEAPKVVENYVDIDALAEYYIVSVSTIRTWIRLGLIPAYSYLQVGKTYRFRVAEVDAALRAARSEKTKATLVTDTEVTNPDQDI